MTTLRPLLAPLLLAAAVLASGCVAPGTEAPADPAGASAIPVDWAVRALPGGEGHDHFDLAQHQGLSTANFEVVGWDPLVTDALGASAGSYYCGEVAETADGRRLAVVNSFASDVAFVVADVTDPAMPVKVGEYVLPNVQVYDVAMTPEGQHVVVGADPQLGMPSTGPAARLVDLPTGAPGLVVQPLWRDACTGETRTAGPEQVLPLAPATLLIGIHDPASPTFEDAHPAPFLGPHSVSTGQIDGKPWIISAITNLVHQGSYYQFFDVLDTPAGHKLSLQSVFQAPSSGGTTVPVINGHVDAAIHKHPATGKPVAYLADWDAGLVILDMSNPRAPMMLSQWSEFKGGLGYLAGEETGNLHEALPLDELWDGKHYTIVGQEIVGKPADHPTGWVYVLDTTDPASPVEAGRWTLPVDVEWDVGLQFSTHYVEVVGRTLFVTLYHGGVWAVDLSTPEAIAKPPTIGAFLPDRVSPSPPAGENDYGIPEVLDVLAYSNGDLVVYDAASGLYVVRFDGGNPAPAPEPWPVPGE